MKKLAFNLLLAAVALAASAHPSRAAYTVTFAPDGLGDVTATGSGTLNVSALTLQGTQTVRASVGTGFPLGTDEFTGPATLTNVTLYSGISNGGEFATTAPTNATSGTGDMAGIIEGVFLQVPTSYTSGALLTDTSVYAGASIASLGLTPGTYTSTWGSGSTADSFTVIIAGNPVVPEPSTNALALLALGSAGVLAWRKRRGEAHAHAAR